MSRPSRGRRRHRSTGQAMVEFALVAPMFFLLIAYALSAGNAGTGFRYRTHIVVLGGAMLMALREGIVPERVASEEVSQDRAPAEHGRRLAAVQ